jgi:hypothetical protein
LRKAIRTQWSKFNVWENTSGSINLEASMVFPWVLMMTFLLLLFSLYVSQGALLYYGSTITAERAAFVWSNSAKDSRTGTYPPGQYDGLYWRLLDDQLLEGLLGLATERQDVNVELYPGMVDGSGSSTSDKLRKIGHQLNAAQAGGKGFIRYRNIGVKREIGVNLTSGWLPEPLIRFHGGGAATAETSALVVEPVEFLRSFDLVRYYATKMKAAPEGAETYRDNAAAVLRKKR